MSSVLRIENIRMNERFDSKYDAIRMAGELLVKGGYVSEHYVEEMIKREDLSTTYIGNDIAIPHGTESAKNDVLESGISVIQVPEGVDFNGEKARVVFGIAGKDNTHLEILSNIAIFCSDMDNVEKIVAAKNEEEIMSLLGGI
ncbi:PTS sugar transporter subunit IIA [Proteiniclasticum ruminis]|jgi:PTS system mannitol-specific IIC component|uniref:Mannitol-specific phosphotransferase enzyme IIA component n=1 Tax=Proteiniclasticum ruminis TaxID=398199 RepID=A0A1G8PK31_9CLOT|nr:PTS sugar transporter subunit IIA [Proteiniclasticum ruminis]SDI92200.1 PTS system, mannitol-specific IIC component [Proteiniclasticum ruminis]